MTELVVTVKASYCRYEISVQLVYDLSCRITAAVPLLACTDYSGFIKSLKYKMLVIILEVIADLRPYLFKPVACRLVIVLGRIVPCFVMYVEDNIHIVFHAVINYLFYTGKPFVAYLILRSFACAPVPRCGNTQNIEACFLDLVDPL